VVGAVYFVREGLKWTTDVKAMQAQAEEHNTSKQKGKRDDS
jgi:hypothetical protein